MPVPPSTSVSPDKLANPLVTSFPPVPSELRQPASLPTGLELPHGQADAVPSPRQNERQHWFTTSNVHVSPRNWVCDASVPPNITMWPSTGESARPNASRCEGSAIGVSCVQSVPVHSHVSSKS